MRRIVFRETSGQILMGSAEESFAYAKGVDAALTVCSRHFEPPPYSVDTVEPIEEYANGFAWCMGALYVERLAVEVVRAYISGDTGNRTQFDIGAEDAQRMYLMRHNQHYDVPKL